MNLYLRLFWQLLSGFWKRPAELLDETELKLRVLPNDLDIYLHMNNGRYATIMDLGRLDYLQRTGLLKQSRRHQWVPVVAQVDLNFLRPLKLFQAFALKTKVVYWDTHWVFLEQTFISNSKPMAKALIKTQFRKNRQRVEVQKILDSIGYTGVGLPMPEIYRHRMEES